MKKKSVIIGLLIVLLDIVFISILIIWQTGLLLNKLDWTAQLAIWAHSPEKCEALAPTESVPAGPNDAKGTPYTVYPRDVCLSYYLHATADATTCDKMTEQKHRNLCFDYLAEVFTDPLWCDSAWSTSELLNIQCKARVTGDITLCDGIDGLGSVDEYLTQKAMCISAVAYTNRDYTQCLTITATPERTDTTRNACLLDAVCDKPELREVVCELIDYTDESWHKSKDKCLEETGFCSDLWNSRYAVPFKR